ncbi:MAG: hypothetical protein PHC98_02785 [Syntrophotalea acetylenica]|uniref:Uncharacterized protein n=1 Tax=Syntrophotalea acetylenica TaxID=29542 RepID=A0A1L3GHK5_SYNAC|nr:hypothetical protein [Syntrophotalea acetylenica]APG25148.1 hypothetical protein A7E75_09035 [Syntrophotalea acetylenica]APG43217.1 hypothetical protein A6070_03010 [Syntrophotalea acetylenica]MDD4456491.1 hypothetical protein [Syntrophotalea acetylenica]MDY0261416.1 hypothetical protein [Syntrophotalea acetylenica]
MPVSAPRIVRETREFIAAHGEDWPGWYVGISVDPSDRLPDYHKVRFGHDRWFCREAFTPEEARAIKTRLVEDHGIDSDDARDEAQGKFLYLYRKAPHTEP